jgi:hypothetical protein
MDIAPRGRGSRYDNAVPTCAISGHGPASNPAANSHFVNLSPPCQACCFAWPSAPSELLSGYEGSLGQTRKLLEDELAVPFGRRTVMGGRLLWMRVVGALVASSLALHPLWAEAASKLDQVSHILVLYLENRSFDWASPLGVEGRDQNIKPPCAR